MSGLQSKVIVVTGGTAGMGEALSRRAASDARHPVPGQTPGSGGTPFTPSKDATTFRLSIRLSGPEGELPCGRSPRCGAVPTPTRPRLAHSG